jgi:hypothetical protein
MAEHETTPNTAAQRIAAARATARGETFRLARDSGAGLVTRPMLSPGKERTIRDVEPLAGARAARDLELAARGTARDYIRQAREAGHSWDQIGDTLGTIPGGDAGHTAMTAAEAAYTYAAGHPDTEAPWRPRSFTWTCRSCNQAISDQGLIAGPADDEHGHADDCSRLTAAVADWNTGLETELEAGL